MKQASPAIALHAWTVTLLITGGLFIATAAMARARARPYRAYSPASRQPVVTRSAAPATGDQAAAPTPGSLDAVLSAIDKAAANLHSLIAQAEAQTYTAVVQDTSTEAGTLYYERRHGAPELALDLSNPAPKIFIYKNQHGWLDQPAIKQVQEVDLSKHQSLVEQFLLLGIGGSGHGMLKSFDVSLAGQQAIGAVNTTKLHLVPKDSDLKDKVSAVDLWYDPQTWIVVQQQFFMPGGDYRLYRYSNLTPNARVPVEKFDTSFPGSTVIHH
jgi:outer membrane lipoprotein-sorting protein